MIKDFRDDNVRYVELRTTPRAVAATGMTKKSYIVSVLTAIKVIYYSIFSVFFLLLINIAIPCMLKCISLLNISFCELYIVFSQAKHDYGV